MEKRKDVLLCIDSDGCVMDAMDNKHKTCFGPCFIEEWELFSEKDRLLKRWDTINLFSMHRGINRFKGLLMILEEVDRDLRPVAGLAAFAAWVSETKALSEASLEEALTSLAGFAGTEGEDGRKEAPGGSGDFAKIFSEKADSDCMKKALSWSRKVNAAIEGMDKSLIRPFAFAAETIREAKKSCTIAVVSSANKRAVEEEWERYGLLSLTDYFFAQDAGTKKACIQRLLEEGYDRARVMMIGDAPGDYEAAAANGVHFYPILAGHEADSWERAGDAVKRLLAGDWSEAFQKELLDAFYQNLKEEP